MEPEYQQITVLGPPELHAQIPEALGRSGYLSYFLAMKTVGVKDLKDNLDKYLEMAQGGETILVTERNQVIAQINEPTAGNRGKMGGHSGARHAGNLSR